VGCLARVVQIKRIERQAEEDGPEPEESATVAIPVGRPASFLLTLEMVKRLRVHELITQHPFIKARCELLTQPTFEQQVTAGVLDFVFKRCSLS
jgi:hypothetical protein